jgi:hypothetical protein
MGSTGLPLDDIFSKSREIEILLFLKKKRSNLYDQKVIVNHKRE